MNPPTPERSHGNHLDLMRHRLLCLPLLVLIACDPGDRPMPGTPADVETFSGDPAGGTLVVLSEREPDELSPLTYASLPANEVAHLVFRSLGRRDSTLTRFRPDLAERWDVSDDGREVRITLRDDVHWHDGAPVTADDVVFTIERQRDPETASTRRADVEAVETAEALDSHTVRVSFREPGPYALHALLQLMPAPRHLLGDVQPARLRDAPFGREPVGNGMYRFHRWDRGESITLVAHRDGPEPQPAIERIVLRFVPDQTAAVAEVLAGQADLVRVPADQRGRIEADRRTALRQAARVRPAWLAWNTDRPPVDDRRVRRALLMAVDREALVRGLFGEVGEVAWSPIPSAIMPEAAAVEPITFDPEGARTLLDEAGWREGRDGMRRRGDQRLRLEVEYSSTDATRRDVLVALQAMVRRVGVDLVPRPYESTTWVDRLRAREFTGSFWGWGWGPGVAGKNAEMVFHSRSIPPGGPNFAGYSSAEADRAIDTLLRTFDARDHSDAWQRLERELIADAVYAPLYMDPELYAISSRVRHARFWGVEWWEDVHLWSLASR